MKAPHLLSLGSARNYLPNWQNIKDYLSFMLNAILVSAMASFAQ